LNKYTSRLHIVIINAITMFTELTTVIPKFKYLYLSNKNSRTRVAKYFASDLRVTTVTTKVFVLVDIELEEGVKMSWLVSIKYSRNLEQFIKHNSFGCN